MICRARNGEKSLIPSGFWRFMARVSSRSRRESHPEAAASLIPKACESHPESRGPNASLIPKGRESHPEARFASMARSWLGLGIFSIAINSLPRPPA